MSRDALVQMIWADGEYTFRLGWGELEALQEACDAGPWVILERLYNRQCRSGEIAHVIRQGLIGGGKTPVEATTLVRTYVEKRVPDLAQNLLFATAILQTAIHGTKDEPVGEHQAASQTGSNSTASPMEKSDLPQSTEMEQH
ncbi:gene transfer agent family protein [Paenochrobactrum sp. BZR 201-1]